MTFDALDLLFPIILAIHNIDEYSCYDDFVRAFHPRLAKKLTTRRVIRDAAILLTLAVAVLGALTYVYKGAVLTMISKVAIFALLLNGIGHCVLSIKRRALVPGTLSAVALVLPYSVIAIVIMRTSTGDTFRSLFCYALFGALSIPLAVLSFLWISYGLSQLIAHTRKR
ncbi:MAG: HXXEE domain-containing protein [Acidobacteriaceae bacterium]